MSKAGWGFSKDKNINIATNQRVEKKNQAFWDWFEKVHAYTWEHFIDPEYGEWYGYLNRQGKVLLPLKGGKWKGCFHVPRGLWQCWKTLELMVNNN